MPMSETPSRLEWGSHEIIGPVHIYRERLMLAWLRRFVGVGTILDAGCGTGSLMIALAKKGFRVCGVERSVNGLRWLVQKADEAGVLPDVATAQADVEGLPFATASFQAIVCGEVLEHLVNDAAAVADFHRILRPKGLCVITVPAHPKLWSFCDEYAGHRRRYTKEMLLGLFESKGFRVLRVGNWGFPLIRLYQRLIFRPYMYHRKKKQSTAVAQMPSGYKNVADIVLLSIAFLFSVDNLFLWGHWGVGFVLVAQKIAE